MDSLLLPTPQCYPMNTCLGKTASSCAVFPRLAVKVRFSLTSSPPKGIGTWQGVQHFYEKKVGQ